MSSMLTVEDSRLDEIVTAAIRNATKVVLTCRRRNGWEALKGAFVTDPTSARRVLVTSQDTGPLEADPAFEPGQRIGVSFRRGHRKCIFTTVVESPPHHASNVIALRWPETLQQMQRRVYHRASPPPGHAIGVDIRAGHLDDDPDQPAGPPIVSGTLEDLSVGGIRVLCNQDPVLVDAMPVVCSFNVAGGRRAFALNAVFRHAESRGVHHSLGFQFIGLESRTDGPDTLAQLARTVTNFQRAESRRRYRHRR